ncbi:dermonecrotic toxin domain-containing protein [Erwinia tasmaniensis]|uniref:Probable cytotoxic necrotizing factor 1 n=1 Tax=Erwinia tasmaniensis (strain DSM 17950 / CFBP 7177 / CIP 109463 / NCPPB 4357 / Et1/99) TaxID=465817 RepID=B2VHY9_ERWT9|nr:DUF6543 domain-containing protein [Erwinia tasmaniensis]CAO95854.1 Probable cytotoxic necrotizing factor 1 [Erwinia tasmaniensis Et1/99]
MPISPALQNTRDLYTPIAQKDSVSDLSKNLGRHSNNIMRQDLSNLFLHCLSRATCARQSYGDNSTVGNNTHTQPVIYPSSHNFIFVSQYPAQCTHGINSARSDPLEKKQKNDGHEADLIQLERQVCQAIKKFTQLQAKEPALKNPHAEVIAPFDQPATTAIRVGSKIIHLLSKIAGMLDQAGNFIVFHDPIRFPLAEAFHLSQNNAVGEGDDNRIIESIEGTIFQLKNAYGKMAIKETEPCHFIATGREALKKYVEKYASQYPDLRDLAATVLRERIGRKFNLDIDPDKNYFITFMERFEDGVNITYFMPLIKKTLTECLFTNFGSDFWKYYVRVDAVSAIYDISYLNSHTKNFEFGDRIKIDPTKFGDLVWEIDFYNYAKQKLTEQYKHKNEHIKNIFISFINHLDSSEINRSSAIDVLNGVGLLRDGNVTVTPFDINGYGAANAFVFRNKNSGQVTLYLPKSDFKFFPFRGDFEMRSWVTNACGSEKNRAMIASHFTLANRRSNLFYDGIDAWLKTLSDDNLYVDRVAINTAEVSSEVFFSDLFTSIKNKALSDLHSQIKSDTSVGRDIYEEMIEASNIIPNPISPFLSLAIHIEHAIDADTYEEQIQEWSKIKDDAVSFIMMVVLDKAIKLPDTEGYEFIDSVKKGFDRPILSIFTERLKKNGELTINDARYIYREAPAGGGLTDEQIEHIKTINAFLPIRKVPFAEDMVTLTADMNSYITRDLSGHPYDLFYGFHQDNLAPPYITLARTKYRMAFRSAQENIALAISRISDLSYEHEIKGYLALSLNTRSEKILSEALLRLKGQLGRARDFLSTSEINAYNNIVIVSTRRIVDVLNPFNSHSTIADQNVLRKIPLAFTYLEDPGRRIFIMLDSNVEHKAVGSSIMEMNVNYLDSTFIHETSHLTSCTSDICYNGRFEEVFLPGDTRALRQQLYDQIESGELKNNIHFNLFMRTVYQHFGITQPVDAETGLNIIKTTPMLKSNLIMDNADNFVAHVNTWQTWTTIKDSKETRIKKITEIRIITAIWG